MIGGADRIQQLPQRLLNLGVGNQARQTAA